MSESKGERPAWAYTLSAAVIFIAASAVLGQFDDGISENDFLRVVTILGWLLAAGGAVQFLMSRRS